MYIVGCSILYLIMAQEFERSTKFLKQVLYDLKR